RVRGRESDGIGFQFGGEFMAVPVNDRSSDDLVSLGWGGAVTYGLIGSRDYWTYALGGGRLHFGGSEEIGYGFEGGLGVELPVSGASALSYSREPYLSLFAEGGYAYHTYDGAPEPHTFPFVRAGVAVA